MTQTIIGYARCSTDEQDLTAQRQRLAELGVADDRIYLDHGLTGTTRARPGLDHHAHACGCVSVAHRIRRAQPALAPQSASGDGTTCSASLTERGSPRLSPVAAQLASRHRASCVGDPGSVV